MTLPAGTRLGPYEILSPLGGGGMGEVYRARDTRLGREIALKVLREAVASNPERLSRFAQEARSASALNHPNVVTIHDIGSAGEVTYIGMELVAGSTLRELLADGPLPPRQLISIGTQVAGGLAAAHEAGIVHRDLKPENVIVSPDGRVKILDFGLAKLATPASGSGSQLPTAAEPTQPGTILGTVGYMSPEQVRGLALDRRTDIFSLGAMLYEMAGGARPFQRATPADVMTAILKEDPQPLPPATPPALDRILRRCLEKLPEQRFQSSRDLAFALDALSTVSSPAAEPGPPIEARKQPHRFIPLLIAAAGSFLIAWFLRPVFVGPREPRLGKAVRLTTGPHLEFGAAISPDGKWVAYLSNARGPVDVWVKFVMGGEAVNLTEKTGLQVQSGSDIGGLDISPDGSLIAFNAGPAGATPREYSSWVIPAPLGGTPRLLNAESRGARWSPDGKRIAFVRAGASRGDGLAIADADGGNVHEVLKQRGGLHAHWLAWSPDGRFLYFIYGITTRNGEPSEIFRVSTAGGEPEAVVRTSRRAVFPQPWPDGRGLLYCANPDSVDLALWWRPGGGVPVRLTHGVGSYAEPRSSADGRALVATVVESREGLVSMPVRFDGSGSPQPITDGFSRDHDPTLSPRGNQLVWSSARSGDRNLWTAAPDGTGARPLTAGAAFDERPSFSPDGKRVAFVSDRSGERGIWLVASEGGAPRFLTRARVLDTLTWSPDGTEIVFAAPAGDLPGLFRASISTGKIERLPTPGGAHAPAWRPGAAEIAYLDPAVAKTRLRFVDPSGRALHTDWAEGPFLGNGLLAWTPDGSRLVAAHLPGGQEAVLWVVEMDGRFRKLAALPVAERVRGLAFSADGGSILFGDYQPSSDIVLFRVE